MTAKPFASLAIFLGAVAIAGCGRDQDKLYDVSGTVTYDGQPVPKGLIFFDPDVTKGGTGPQGLANIWNGKFNTADKGKGVRGGAYVVRVNGFDGKEAPEAPFGKFLFPEHTEPQDLPKAKSELNVTIEKKR
jgi:hypothetical protein